MQTNLNGISGTTLELGVAGPKLKNSSGAVEARNNGDSDYAIVRGASPAGDDDLTTQEYVLEQVTGYIRQDGAAGFTRTSTSTFTVTDNATNQCIFVPGLPIAYRTTAGSGSFSYGILKSYSSGTVTIMGIAFPSPLGELRVGPAYKVAGVTLQVAGALTTGDDKLNTVMNTVFDWPNSDAFLVAARGKVETAASGANLHVAIGVGAAGTDLFNSPVYLYLAQSTNQVDSAVNISSSNYAVDFWDKLFVNIDQVGSGTAGSDLTIQLLGVFA